MSAQDGAMWEWAMPATFPCNPEAAFMRQALLHG